MAERRSFLKQYLYKWALEAVSVQVGAVHFAISSRTETVICRLPLQLRRVEGEAQVRREGQWQDWSESKSTTNMRSPLQTQVWSQ